MLKKAILTACLVCLLAPSAFAVRTSYEPETATAVSYGTLAEVSNRLEMTFVKYATQDPAKDEYWIRARLMIDKEKLLSPLTLTLDGTAYELQAQEPQYYQRNAAESVLETPDFADMWLTNTRHSAFRYFPMTPEMASKLMTAAKVQVTFSRIHRINNTYDIGGDTLKAIQANLKPEFVDFHNYWKPEVGNN